MELNRSHVLFLPQTPPTQIPACPKCQCFLLSFRFLFVLQLQTAPVTPWQKISILGQSLLGSSGCAHPGLPSPLTPNPPATAAKTNPANPGAVDKSVRIASKCHQSPGYCLEMHRAVPLSSPGLWCHSLQGCVPVPGGCGQALLSLPCVGAPGWTLGLVGHEAEEQSVHFSTVAATVSASASSCTVTERGHFSC